LTRRPSRVPVLRLKGGVLDHRGFTHRHMHCRIWPQAPDPVDVSGAEVRGNTHRIDGGTPTGLSGYHTPNLGGSHTDQRAKPLAYLPHFGFSRRLTYLTLSLTKLLTAMAVETTVKEAGLRPASGVRHRRTIQAKTAAPKGRRRGLARKCVAARSVNKGRSRSVLIDFFDTAPPQANEDKLHMAVFMKLVPRERY